MYNYYRRDMTTQTYRLFTTDPKALNHILANSAIYQKPSQIRWVLRTFAGEGS